MFSLCLMRLRTGVCQRKHTFSINMEINIQTYLEALMLFLQDSAVGVKIEPKWIFKEGSAENTRLMNLINLPMLKSQAIKKLTSSSSASNQVQRSADKDSLKKRIKSEFAKALESGSSSSSVNEPNTGGGDENEQEVDPKRQRTGKNLLKSIAFKGYDEREKASYDVNIMSFQNDTSRPVTALDEILSALLLACKLFEKETGNQTSSEANNQSASLSAKKKKSSGDFALGAGKHTIKMFLAVCLLPFSAGSVCLFTWTPANMFWGLS